jgi:universal stress protein A
MTIKTILVPTDFSENAQVAFEEAYNLARQTGAKLLLLHIQDGSTLRIAVKEQLLGSDSTDEQLQAAVGQLTEARFSEILAGLDRSEVTIECISLRGYPKTAIVNYAEEVCADLVVIGMRGITAMSMITSALMGSVAEHVMRHSPCPTLIVRADHTGNDVKVRLS